MEEYNFSSNGIESKVTFFNALEYLTITLSNTKNKFFLNKLITNVALNKTHFSLHFYSLTSLHCSQPSIFSYNYFIVERAEGIA